MGEQGDPQGPHEEEEGTPHGQDEVRGAVQEREEQVVFQQAPVLTGFLSVLTGFPSPSSGGATAVTMNYSPAALVHFRVNLLAGRHPDPASVILPKYANHLIIGHVFAVNLFKIRRY